MQPLPHTGTRVVVLQPGYLPWLGFFDQMQRADVFVYYDDVQYDTGGWRNRNRIKAQDGVQWLTVPVRHSGLGSPRIIEVEIDNRRAWARKHVATMRQAYARARFVPDYLPAIEAMLSRRWDRLVDLDITLIEAIAGWLGLRPHVVRASELGIEGARSERLLGICRQLGATEYVSGDAARAYLDLPLFERHGIRVTWQAYAHPVYPQQHGAFVPYLSIVDLLFNCGPSSRDVLLGGHPDPAIEVEQAT